MNETRRWPSLVPCLALAMVAGLGSWPLARAEPGNPQGDVQRFGVDDGLPQSTVNTITHDATGYLWLGTLEGLARFDGSVFTTFDSLTTPELASKYVTALLPGRDGRLWIGTASGLLSTSAGRFRTHGLDGEVVEDLALDSSNTLWVGTRRGLSRLAGEQIRTFTRADGLAGDSIFALCGDERGDLWVGSQEGLSRIRGDRVLAVPQVPALTDALIVALAVEPGGPLWLGTVNNGLLRLDRDSMRITQVAGPGGGMQVFSLLWQAGSLWVGTRTGLLRLHAGQWEDVAALDGENIISLAEDRSGGIWAGTLKSGLVRLPRRRADEEPTRALGPTVVLEQILIDQLQVSPGDPPPEPRGRADFEFRFAAIEFDEPESVTYRYQLEGYEDQSTEAGNERYVSYTNLPPGAYRFRVWSGGLKAALDFKREATYSFRIAPRFHQTPWFKALIGLLVLAVTFVVYRLRTRRLVRTQEALVRRVDEQTREILEQNHQLQGFHQRLAQTHQLLQQTNLELKARNREKSDFLAIATHDLRAPLVNLKGFTAELRFAVSSAQEFLASSLPELAPPLRERATAALFEEAPEALGFIESASQRMERLIEPILRLARLSRRPLRLQPVSLEDTVREVIERLAPRLRETGARVDVDPLPGVLADAQALREVIEQLLSRALDALEPGYRGRIAIQARRDDRRTIVSITDNGRPISEVESAKVFRIFGHAAGNQSAFDGLGLAYARALVQRHGGQIGFSSQPGAGSTFYFSIPRKPNQKQTEV